MCEIVSHKRRNQGKYLRNIRNSSANNHVFIDDKTPMFTNFQLLPDFILLVIFNTSLFTLIPNCRVLWHCPLHGDAWWKLCVMKARAYRLIELENVI